MIFVGNKANLTVVSALDDMNRDICRRYSRESNHFYFAIVYERLPCVSQCFSYFEARFKTVLTPFILGMTMQIPSITNTAFSGSISILKLANEQPKLAGELISKTVEGIIQIQSAQTPAQRVDVSEISGTGKIINITV